MIMADMNPCNFPGADITMNAPENWVNGVRGPCEPLPIMHRDGVSISCWQAGWRDRLRFFIKGKVSLHVVGQQPPVMIVVE